MPICASLLLYIRQGSLAVLITLLLSVPFSVAADGSPVLLVGFAQDHLANDWRLAQVKQIETALAAHPRIRFTYTDANGSTARQIQDIEDLIISGVDILITSPRDGLAMTPVIQRAYREGIAVVLLTRQIASDDYTSFISPDDTVIARAAAHYMAREMNGQGRLLILEGVSTASTTHQRTESFLETLKEYPKMKVVARKIGNYLRNDAIRAVEEVLAEGIGFDGIYAHSDSMASGARMALKLAGIDPAEQVIIGIDYIQEAREAIIRGEQRASFTYPTSALEAVDVVLKIAAGKTPSRTIVVPSQQVDRQNVHQIEPIF